MPHDALHTPSGPWVPRVPASPQYTPDTLYTPWCPWYSQNGPYSPYTPRIPLMPLYPFWFSIVITLQLTIFMQLKHSYSIVIVSNSHHFATDHLHAVKMLIFYHHHFQLLSLCNGPSSGVCPLYNIPSSGVKGTSAVLWSSANFCSISQNMHYKDPVASQQWKTNQVVWTWKDDWLPGELLLTKDLFTREGNYLLYMLKLDFGLFNSEQNTIYC